MASPTILVVDDDEDIRSTVADALGDHGFQALTAANGSEALRMLRDDALRPL
jgi:DNA-binding response OmpR family regulator